MTNSVFVLLLGSVLMPALWWAYGNLPKEEWQIIASIPAKKDVAGPGQWHGINVTFYGFLLASGGILGVGTFFLLLASLAIPLAVIIGLIVFILACSTAAAKLVAVFVEKKQNTLTVAGGAFVGLMLMPAVVAAYNALLNPAPKNVLAMMPVMAALAISYALGEGVGRLACLSFGCCYGKPVTELGPLARKIFSRFHVTFQGHTKKIVYASGLAGVKVVPVQAITSFLYVSAGLFGMYLFLEAHFAAAFAVTAIFTLAWRVYSEQIRADYRGQGGFTVYQRLGLAGIFYCAGLLVFSSTGNVLRTNLLAGLTTLWNPWVILFFQALWLALFLYTGLSKVTGATVAFHVRREQV